MTGRGQGLSDISFLTQRRTDVALESIRGPVAKQLNASIRNRQISREGRSAAAETVTRVVTGNADAGETGTKLTDKKIVSNWATTSS